MSSDHEDVTKLSWKERRYRNKTDPDYLREKCRGSSHIPLFTIAAALPACVLTSSALPLALATAVGVTLQYISYRKCVHSIDKSYGVIPGYPFPASRASALPSTSS